MKVSTSILSCKNYEKVVGMLSFTNTDYIHIDFIDNTYVKGTKIPFRKIKRLTSPKRFDVHLMTKKVKKWIKKCAHLNCEYITFHIEATKDIDKYIDLVKSFNIKVGLAISPDTDINMLEPYLDKIDLILVMSVYPGYGGQSFIPETEERLKNIKKMVNGKNITISVDGGINDETYPKVKNSVDMVVSGSYITGSKEYEERINSLKK